MEEMLTEDKNIDSSYVISTKLPGRKKKIDSPTATHRQCSQQENCGNKGNRKSRKTTVPTASPYRQQLIERRQT